MKCKISISGNLILTPEKSLEAYALRKWHEDNTDAAVIIRGLNEPDDPTHYIIDKDNMKPVKVEKRM